MYMVRHEIDFININHVNYGFQDIISDLIKAGKDKQYIECHLVYYMKYPNPKLNKSQQVNIMTVFPHRTCSYFQYFEY